MSLFNSQPAARQESRTVSKADGEVLAPPVRDRKGVLGRAYQKVVIIEQSHLDAETRPGHNTQQSFSYLGYPEFVPQQPAGQVAFDRMVGQTAATEAVDPDENFLVNDIPGAKADLSQLGVEQYDRAAEAARYRREVAAAQAAVGTGQVAEEFFTEHGLQPQSAATQVPQQPAERASWNVPVEAGMADPQMPQNAVYLRSIENGDVDQQQRVADARQQLQGIWPNQAAPAQAPAPSANVYEDFGAAA